MLKVFNILLLVSMASMCRALAEWSVLIKDRSEVMVLTNETHLFFFGTQVSPHESNTKLSIVEYDSNGSLLQLIMVDAADLLSVKAAVIEDNDFILLKEVKDKNTNESHYLSICRVTKKGEIVWVKNYSQKYLNLNFCLSQAKEGYLIGGTSYNYLVSLTMVNKEGDVVWNKAYNVKGILKGLVRSGEGYFLITISTSLQGSQISYINVAGELQSSLHMIGMLITAFTKEDSGGIVLIYNTVGSHYIVKVNHNCTIEWKVPIYITVPFMLKVIKRTINGEYIAAGCIVLNKETCKEALVKFYPEGRIRWKKVFDENGLIGHLVEDEQNTYYMMTLKEGLSFQRLRKYSVPKYAEGLHCAEYEQCKACGLGFYWNYTSCVPCSVGCVECLDIDHCINCSSRYAKTEDNRCIPVEEPCNCDLPNLTPECREKCALPVCSSNSSLPFTYKTDNKKVCTCPDEMLSNETHCLPKTDVGCHPLCDICAGEYCLQCKNITGIFVSRTHSIAVKCQCDYGYQFNSTACIPVKRIHNVQSSESLVAIALGIIGGLVAVGSVAFIMYLKYRRDEWMHGENLPDIQTGKEQHTVEVSKEMEVHAITRDDERTGEIMFKRE
eukprot:TRINITY_DN165_c0_g1_i7.p1 TRINITY_DN165_c0_g1~~TRINITY_DN165_c0_g1_i7.p1  ORF type:complete len:642 (+),score=44.08 TRINITY_DN165_c0_g1_i7:98-1927(+)